MDEEKIKEAIKVLLAASYENLILAADAESNLFIMPFLLQDGDPDNPEEIPPGSIEYQVSEGLPGKRSSSNDFYTFREALDFFNEAKAKTR
jgi:hypothetical protein